MTHLQKGYGEGYERHLLASILGALSLIGLVIQVYAMDDLFPPESNVTIEGIYNNITGWYYGTAPFATFTATDDLSGVKHIVIPYNNGQCGNNQCFLQPGDLLPLDKQRGATKGTIVLTYFAIDNAGNKEKPNKLSILVDTQAPDLHVIKIKTDSRENIPTGYLCKDMQKTTKCVMINARVNEKITFQMFGSDLVSGINSIQYRILKPLEREQKDWQTVHKDIPYTLDLKFDKTGIYHLQLKATDVAGNVSSVRDFWIRIS